MTAHPHLCGIMEQPHLTGMRGLERSSVQEVPLARDGGAQVELGRPGVVPDHAGSGGGILAKDAGASGSGVRRR